MICGLSWAQCGIASMDGLFSGMGTFVKRMQQNMDRQTMPAQAAAMVKARISLDRPCPAYGIAPTGSIMRWMMDGWLTELTSKAAAKRSSNETPAIAFQSNVIVAPILVVRLRKLQPSAFISSADAGGVVSSGNLFSTTGSVRRRSAVSLRGGASSLRDASCLRGGPSMRWA